MRKFAAALSLLLSSFIDLQLRLRCHDISGYSVLIPATPSLPSIETMSTMHAKLPSQANWYFLIPVCRAHMLYISRTTLSNAKLNTYIHVESISSNSIWRLSAMWAGSLVTAYILLCVTVLESFILSVTSSPTGNFAMVSTVSVNFLQSESLCVCFYKKTKWHIFILYA